MADVYATITQADPALVARVAAVMEQRAADPRQAQMRDAFLDAIEFPAGAEVMEIGCGSGAVCRAIATRSGVGRVIGVDPSPVLLERARDLAAGMPRLRFAEGDGRASGLADASFDVVILYTTLCHVPEPARAVAETYRLLRPGGTLGVFDGDYATTTVALDRHDPLQCCVEAMIGGFVHAPWLARGLAPMLRAAGFRNVKTASHGYAAVDEPDYMLSVIDRGADALAADGNVGAALADALKSEARRRVETGRFFGQIGYFHAIGRKLD